jgi:excisionase family DNA binding protein
VSERYGQRLLAEFTADPAGRGHPNGDRPAATGRTNHDPIRPRRREVTMNELLTVKEAANRLGTAERFIRRLIFERRIPYTKLGRHVRIAARDLDAFVRAGRVEAGRTSLDAPRA